MPRMGLPRPPTKGRVQSWGLWHLTYPQVRALTLRGDVAGLLALLDERGADEESRFSERALVACALGSFGTDAAVEHLAALVRPHESLSVRVCAADALRRIGGPAASEAVMPGLDDNYWSVQYAAVKTLDADPLPEAWPMLAALATGGAHPMVRSVAAEALARAKSDVWIPTLEATGQDPSIQGWLGGANALVRTETPAALDALRKLKRGARPIRRLAFGWAGLKLRRKLRRRGTLPVR